MKRTIRHPRGRRSAGSTITLATLLAACAGPAIGVGDTVATYRMYESAINAGDATAATAVWAADGRFAGALGCSTAKPCTNRAQVRAGFIEPAVAMRMSHRMIGAPKVEDAGKAQFRIEIAWPDIVKLVPGVQRIVGTDAVQVENGLIVSKVFTPDMADEQTRTFYETVAKARPRPADEPPHP
ncbi:MAG: hypothetical protein QM674_08880 [Burkholderiaceae bacterium]